MLPLHTVRVSLLSNVGEYEFGIIALQREQQFAYAGRYRDGAQHTPLAQYGDLPARPIYVSPAQAGEFLAGYYLAKPAT
jgi:hypothetical protein